MVCQLTILSNQCGQKHERIHYPISQLCSISKKLFRYHSSIAKFSQYLKGEGEFHCCYPPSNQSDKNHRYNSYDFRNDIYMYIYVHKCIHVRGRTKTLVKYTFRTSWNGTHTLVDGEKLRSQIKSNT